MDNYQFEPFRQIALTFPGTVESVSHNNTPSIKVRGKLMCRLHENGEYVPLRIDKEIREKYLASYPEIFILPDHFVKYNYLCILIEAFDSKIVREIMEISWRGLASKTQIKNWEEQKK